LPRALLMDRLFPDWLARCKRCSCSGTQGLSLYGQRCR
jgi:hypothetical protein